MGIETAIIGSAVLGAYGASRQSSAATSAAQTQAGSAREAMQQQREMFDILNQQQAPYRELAAGEGGALSQIRQMLPYFTRPVTGEDIQAMPGYQFGLQQGLGAVGQQMNVGGGGSNVERARQKFAIDYTMGQALPAYLKQRTDIYNTLASIAGIGQKATETGAQTGMGTAGALSQLGIGAGSALAGGQIGAANAMAGGLQSIGNLGMMYNLMKPLTAIQAPAPVETRTVPIDLEGLTPSDIRLKTNITKVGTRPDGLGIYQFDYIWGGGRRTGLMAQEVREVYPDAVVEMDNGFLAVDYGKV